MKRLEISLHNMTRLCHLASLGNLLGGLIHNLNSPLHSLGMQMDMMQHFLLKEDQSGNEFLEKFSHRLSQMNGEFEKLTNQVRIISMRADFLDYPPKKLDINHFLHQEFEFLKGNLYFKHHVKAKLELAPSLPTLTPVPPYFYLGMGLFFEGLVEEFERGESRKLCVGTKMSHENPVIYISMTDMEISETFYCALKIPSGASPLLGNQEENINLYIAVLLLMHSGVTVETELKERDLSIQLTLVLPCAL